MEKKDKQLSDEEEAKLRIMLYQLCEMNGLNKVSDVTYDEDMEQITTIKHIDYDEESKCYIYKQEIKKPKQSQKSKGNIDRHFSRSKESKR